MVNIICVCKDKEGDITHLGGSPLLGTADAVLFTIDSARREIEKGTKFFVNHKGKSVEIRPHYDRKGNFLYLATVPDGIPINNLDNLVRCKNCS